MQFETQILSPEVQLQKRLSFYNESNQYSAVLVVKFFQDNCGFEEINILHDKEKVQLQAYSYRKRKESYYFGRISGKIAVCNFLNIGYQDFYISKGVFTQPVVCCNNGNKCQVSISHTDYASASIAFDEKHPMGIDIEEISGKNSEIVEKYFTSHERKYCQNKRLTLTIWTAKEAVSKALKTGFTIPLYLFEINSIEESEGICSLTFKIFSQFKVLSFLFQNHIVSIAYPSSSQIEIGNPGKHLFE